MGDDNERTAEADELLALMATNGRRLVREFGRFCPHAGPVAVNTEQREVRCRACKANIDPYEVLARLLRDQGWVDHLQHEKQQLLREREALKAEVSALRSARNRVREAFKDKTPKRPRGAEGS